jgi:hypothetical protein
MVGFDFIYCILLRIQWPQIILMLMSYLPTYDIRAIEINKYETVEQRVARRTIDMEGQLDWVKDSDKIKPEW